MPYRITPLVTGQIYHIYNRGVAQQPMFTHSRDCQRTIEVLWFYHFAHPPMRFSHFNTLSPKQRDSVSKQLQQSETLVTLQAFCLMPNHFHLLLKQEKENGISSYLRNITDSYTKFFNTKYQRNGPLFQGQFKAILVESDEQLLHLSRYIHLNPYTSYVVKDFDQLMKYPWSSLEHYLGKTSGMCETKTVLDFFPSSAEYVNFLEDQAEYQRTLGSIKHLIFE